MYHGTLALKETEFLSLVTMWIDLQGSILNGISQTDKDKHCTISLICEIKEKIQPPVNITKKKQTHRYKKQTSGQQWGEERTVAKQVKRIKRCKLLCGI